MGKLTNLNPPVPITDSDIPAGIARDTEFVAADTAHLNAVDPHPQYLTQLEGDGRYRRSSVSLNDSDIPAGIARDVETAAAIAAHVGAGDPHPNYEFRSNIASKILTGPLTYPTNTWSSFGSFATFSPGVQGAPSAILAAISFCFNTASPWQQACCAALIAPIWWQPASVGDMGSRVWLEFHNQTGFYVNLRFGSLSGDSRQLQMLPEIAIVIPNTGRVDLSLKRLL